MWPIVQSKDAAVALRDYSQKAFKEIRQALKENRIVLLRSVPDKDATLNKQRR